MAITDPASSSYALNAIGGVFKSGLPPVPDDDEWRIAGAYRFDVATPMSVSYPPQGANELTYDYHKWADTKSEYSVRISIKGGEPPFRVIKISQPTWAQLGTGVDVQDFIKTETEIEGVFEFTLPEKYMRVSGTPVSEGTANFEYLVIDQTGSSVAVEWSCEMDDSGRIKYVDSVGGLDANAGTFEAPFQTFPKMWNLTNADQFIFKLKAGTYVVSDGAGGNANFGAGKPRSISGITDDPSLYVFDMSTALMSGSASNIVMKNLKVTGAPALSANPRQIGFNNRATGAHFCGMKFDTRVGTDGGDNPSGIFFSDVGATKSARVSVVDCELLPTSTASLVIYFSVEDGVEENNYCSGVVFPQTNGSLVSHLKGRIVNFTNRFNSYSADSNNGILWVSNQNPEDCSNIEIVCPNFTNIGTGNSAVLRFNGQVHSEPMVRPSGMLLQRASISAGDASPVNFESYVAGDDVDYSGLLWSSSTASTIDTTGGTSLSNTSLKVDDVSVISAPMVGKGARLLSTAYEV